MKKEKRRKWDNEQLEALRKLVNLKYPKNKVNSIDRMKAIIREQEKLHS